MAVCEGCGQEIHSVHRKSLADIAKLLNSMPIPSDVQVTGDAANGEEVITVPHIGRIGWSTPLQAWVVAD